MSLRIMIACEDHTLDQYVACPVIKAMMAHLGRPRADVRVITSPRLRGINTLTEQMCEILEQYGKISDLIIFAVDGDCEDGRDGKPDRHTKLRRLMEACPTSSDKGAVVIARQELEVWALWGSKSKIKGRWSEVTQERDPKERYFEPLLTSADLQAPGRGRQRLVALSIAQGWASLAGGCPELKELEDEVRERLSL
jgi:hypothetical protein